jgi:hypothetical protein
MEETTNITRLQKFVGKSVEEIFSIIYNTYDWKSDGYESVSGEGSTLKHTQQLRSQLPIICKEHGIRRILDGACGDFNWMKGIVHHFEYYKGIDIVKDLITDNTKKYKKAGKIEFECGNIIKSIPNDNYDAIILKDVLVHLPNDDIFRILENLKKSGIKYAFITNFLTVKQNIDLVTAGQWRPLNLTLFPFELGNPIKSIHEKSETYNWFDSDLNPIVANDKAISLWKIQ